MYKFNHTEHWQQLAIDELKKAFFLCEERTGELGVKIHLMSFWNLFYENEIKRLTDVASCSPYKTRMEARMQKLLTFIHEHYAENLSVKNISEVANISESECYRLFKKTLKSTPNQYLTEYRLQKVC
ncbi:AraC family transcriptional regulator [Psychromonas sp. KJ10-10]|uniref:AraC family transcriptional regulator n=1 Tax=Psychromonas sp. KJ10-10 TaxID=3391823 RepID=UPI0039B6046F